VPCEHIITGGGVDVAIALDDLVTTAENDALAEPLVD